MHIICYICDNRFESKMEMMIHRKTNHKELVRGCTNFAKNNCMFQGQSCWYLHEEEEAMETEETRDNSESDEVNNSENETESQSVFQRVFRSSKPPLGKMKRKQNAD